ncbi:MAG: group 1 glycosyl transferase [Candidatus Gottesmanbacteria bacterium GW2011_GWA2_43_14]|uniref:Group 1 glycosyl transferase n=1 Tax=Candidatus Gottesmanbacteria bacterium GW2011_GWA2_43_14 TaxID=1618443 RepID=A0A0G1DL12_9BACT|nr:MAG: group 1 glycosyl transferase [Candidatus Gottesmanbacteria bacterium GW2011_GWA2_43_14]
MKIAVVHNLPAGGQKRALYEQVKRLSLKHELDLFILSVTNENYLPLTGFVKQIQKITYRHPEKFPYSVFSKYTELKNAYIQMAEKINKGDYDIAYVNPCYLTQAPYVLRYLNIPSLYTCPEPKREFYEHIPRINNKLTYNLTLLFRLPLKYIDRENARKADKIVTLSMYSKKILEKIYGRQVSVNRLGVDTDNFRPIKIKKENFALSVGAFTLLKGHDFIINCIARIPEKIRPSLVIAGPEGNETVYLQKLAEQKGVKLRLEMNISDEKLEKLYNQARLFLYAPLNEPFGLVVLEALSTGLYVLTTGGGGIPEILTDSRLGKAVERDEAVFAENIETALKSGIKNGEFRRNYVKENWTWQKSADRLEKLLNETVSQ